MSARFGRNQRRQMRERIAAADRQLEGERWHHAQTRKTQGQLLQRVARLEADIAEWADRIMELLGDKSAFAKEALEVGVDAAMWLAVVGDGQPYQVAPVEPVRSVVASSPAFETFPMRVIDAFAIAAEQARDEVRFRTRFMIRDRDGEVALMMDDRTRWTLKQQGDRALVEYLLRQMIGPWMTGKVRS